MNRAELECGCRLIVDETTELGHFYPCGELHRDLAARLRKPGSRWVIMAAPKRVPPPEG